MAGVATEVEVRRWGRLSATLWRRRLLRRNKRTDAVEGRLPAALRRRRRRLLLAAAVLLVRLLRKRPAAGLRPHSNLTARTTARDIGGW
jgi:hypothetical protein